VRGRVDARLDAIGRVIPVMSGKGGVGKSAVSVSLALALARGDQRVGLLDGDLQSPTLAKMLGMRGQPLRMAGEELLPLPHPDGLLIQSMDFFLQGDQPLAWDGAGGEGAHLRSALEDAALADLIAQTRWGELDYLIVDLAPGSDRLPALGRLTSKLSGALAVSIPSEVSLLAVQRSVRRAYEARIPMIGWVENMGSTVCGHCGAVNALYRDADVGRLTEGLGLPLLARVPFDPALARALDAGHPGTDPDSPSARAFATLAEHLVAWTPPDPEGDTW